MNELIAIGNAAVYVLLVIILLIKYKKFTISIYVLILYATSAIFSYFFIKHPLFQFSLHAGYLTVTPYVYYFATFILFYVPIMAFKEFEIQNIKEPPKLQFSLLLFFISIVSVITSIIYIPEVIQLFSNPAGLAANKMAKEAGDQIVFIPAPFGSIVLIGKIFSDVSILLFFYILSTKMYTITTKFLFGCIILIINPILGIAVGSRATLVFFIFSVFFSYQIFKKNYTQKMRRKTSMVSSVFLIMLVIFIILLSINRFEGAQNGVGFFFLKYLGESFSNFNILLYDQIDNYTFGAKNFSYFTNILGFTDLENINEIREYAVQQTGIPNNYFYTFIGQIFIDFGPIITFLLALFSSVFFWNKFKVVEMLKLSSIVVYYLYLNLLVRGVFFFPYSGKNGNLIIIGTFLVAVLVKYRFKILSKG